MASESSRPAIQSVLRYGLVALLVLLLLFTAAFIWALNSESGARMALNFAASSSGGTLRFDKVDGTLAGPLRIERLVIDQPDRTITLENIRLAWQPRSLLRRELHIDSLRASRVLVAAKISRKQEKARMPDSLRLPLSVHVGELTIDSGEIGWGPMNLVRLGAFSLAFDSDAKRHHLQLREFSASTDRDQTHVSGRLSGELSVDTVRPFALQGRFSTGARAATQKEALDAGGDITLGGSLADIAVSLALAAERAKIQGNASLQPFTDKPLAKADIRWQDLDLSAFRAGLPQTDLHGSLSATQDGNGQLALANHDAGSYQEKRLPVSSLDVTFRQSREGVTFDRIKARLGAGRQGAGLVNGDGRYADGGLALDLAVDGVNLRKLDPRLLSTLLSGRMQLSHRDASQTVTLDLHQPVGKRRLDIDAAAALADERVTLDRARIGIGDGSITAAGRVELAGRQAFAVKGDMARFRLQDLGRFTELPELELSGSFSAQGSRTPRLAGALDFALDGSRIGGRPLQGHGRMQLDHERIDVPGIVLAAGDNRLNAQGALSARDSRIAFSVTAPRLEQLGGAFAGSFNAEGTVRGSAMRPAIEARWNGARLRLPSALKANTLQGRASASLDRGQPFPLAALDAEVSASGIGAGPHEAAVLRSHLKFSPRRDAPLDGDIHAEGIVSSAMRAERFDASVRGTTGQHLIQASLLEPLQRQSWAASAAGGLASLQTAPAWQGELRSLDAKGIFTSRLTSPAALSLSKTRQHVDHLALESSTGFLVLDYFHNDPQGLSTRGRGERMPLAQLLKFKGDQTAISTDLLLDASWNLATSPSLKGQVDVRRRSGDVTMIGASPVTLGLNEFALSLTQESRRVHLALNAQGKRLGDIRVDASAALPASQHKPGLPPQAILSGNAKLDIPSLAWIAPFISPGMTMAGRLQGDLDIGGTYAHPSLDGRITGNGLRIYASETGIDLNNGVLNAAFDGDKLTLQQLAFTNGQGTLAASGKVAFTGGTPQAALRLDAVHFRLLNRYDRNLTLSGGADLGWTHGMARAKGTFSIDSGHFDIGREGMPQLSDDVVIEGRKEKASKPLAADVDVDVNLGENVTLTGKGLDARLGGRVHLIEHEDRALRAQGTVRVVKGSYKAYGRELAIEQGVLRFNGDLRNPALDILAMRRGPEVEAGVAVRGTVLAPRATLVSEPPVSEAEKLSWLVLGKALSTAGASSGGGDMGALQSAASSLLSQSAANGITSQLATAFGLDEFKIGSSDDNLQQRIVTVGKRISSRLYVGYQQSLQTAGSALSLKYTVSPHVTVEAEAGTRAALSLLYNIAFD